MKIVILDGYTLNPGDLKWDSIQAFGTLQIYPRTESDEILERISDADIVLTNKTPLTREVLKQCRSLKLICVLATGYDVIDVAAAKEMGIVVCNVPGYGTRSVSQFAIALLLEICCHVGHHAHKVREGKWIQSSDWCFWDYPIIELNEKVMGIVGYGRIGQSTAAIARSLGMRVIATGHTHFQKDVEYVDIKTLCKKSDVIVLHCSLNEQTHHLINSETISLMKPSAILINNARGELVDEYALAQALNEDKILAAGLDVVSKEPMSKDNPLRLAKNCFITPHMSWGSNEARKRIIDTTSENIQHFLAGDIIHQVNE